MGIEPTTYSLGSCRSTTELRPQFQRLRCFWEIFGAPRGHLFFCYSETAISTNVFAFGKLRTNLRTIRGSQSEILEADVGLVADAPQEPLSELEEGLAGVERGSRGI
jgi:hypothetical protein